jgi:Rrf2 family protein
MDITLSKTADYAVRAALALAESGRDGSYVTIAQVAEQMALPRTFTPHVLALLAHADIAESKAGRGGGYRLTRSPKRISMLDVVEAAEGSLANERCTMRGGPCHWEDRCAVHETWVKAAQALRRSLARTSLAEVAAADMAAATTMGGGAT